MLYLLVPGGPRIAVVEDVRAAKTDERHESAQKSVTLGQRHDVVHDATAEQTKITGVGRDLDFGDAGDHPIADVRDDPLGQRLAGARAPLGVDDLVAVAPARDQLGDQLGRILQVAVDNDDRVARRGLEPRDRRHRLTEPSRKAQHLDAGVLLAKGDDQLLGAVGGGIDAEDQLPLEPKTVEHSAQALIRAPDVGLLVVGGDDDADRVPRWAGAIIDGCDPLNC